MEAWLGSLAGHTVPNVRRPLIHTGNLADLLPLAWRLDRTRGKPLPVLSRRLPAAAARRHDRRDAVPDQPACRRCGPYPDRSARPAPANRPCSARSLCRPCAIRASRSAPSTRAGACGPRCRPAAAVITTWAATCDGPAFCPLSVLETDADVAWAEDWIATCFELQTGSAPCPGEREAIHRAMALLRGPATTAL